MGFNRLRGIWAEAIAMRGVDPELLDRVKRMPENIAVTKAGYAGRVHPFKDGMLDTGFIQPEMYDDGEDHDVARKAYHPVDDTPDLYKFIRQADQNPVWKNLKPTSVSLHQPIYATQAFVHRSHLLRYLGNSNDKTNAQHSDPDSAKDEAHPFTKTPGFVVYRNRLHAVDGHHRTAAEMMRGTHEHITGKVWDADKNGLPMVHARDRGWGSQDPGPPRR